MLFVGTLALSNGNLGIAAGIVTYVALVFNVYVLAVNKDVSEAVKNEYRANAGEDAAYAVDQPQPDAPNQSDAARAAARSRCGPSWPGPPGRRWS